MYNHVFCIVGKDARHTASTKPAATFIEHLSIIPDPRVNRTKHHELTDILVIVLCTLLCGGESFYDMEEFGKAKKQWFSTFLSLPNGIPSHDTFNRVFSALDPACFHEFFINWTAGLRENVSREIVAIDGKALRLACDTKQNIPMMVNSWARENRLVLGQLKVDAKSNEITAVPELLRVLDIEGCIVTTDAMGCQKHIAAQTVEAGADYVLALKGNHETIHREVEEYFLGQSLETGGGPEAVATMETTDNARGRLEVRKFIQSNDLSQLRAGDQWAGLKTIGMVETIRADGNKETCALERRYFLSSLEMDIKTFTKAVRGLWAVENSCHWVLDVSLGEDRSRARSGNAAENLATIRRMALNLLNSERTKKRSIKGKQLAASWNHDYLLRLLHF